jgi:Predicted membrane protein (DUF2142)
MTQQVDVERGPVPAAVTSGTSPRPRRALLLGLCGLFAVWVLVMPPFAGSDEFDHAYKAAAVARGQWAVDPVEATRGTGAFLTVPDDIVEAARGECQHLRYTRDHDCVGRPSGDDRVVASGAGRYHPLFYAVIGAPSLPFHGATALYVMRFATALLAAAFVWLAIRAASTWARTRWPYVAIAVSCTPVVIYSSSIAAPNGVEIMAAMALWMSLIGLLLAHPEDVRRIATYAGISGATLATLRPLGPLWCLLVLGAVLVAVRVDPGRIRGLLRRPAVRLGAALVAVSALQSTVWVMAVGALKVGVVATQHTSLEHRLAVSALQLPAWVLQTIAAFPLRNQATHTAVYACYVLLFGVVVASGLRFGTLRSRASIALIATTMLVLPYVTTVKSIDQFGAAWQGRYGLPVAIGMVVLACVALDRSRRDLRGPTQLALFLLFVAAQTFAPAHTLLREIRDSPQVDSGSWVQPSLLLTVAAAAAFATLMWWGAFAHDRPSSREHASAPH